MRSKRLTALAVVAASVLAGPATAQARPASAKATAAQARTVKQLINSIRARHGLRPVRADRRLARAARGHSRDMLRRGYFAHEGPDGTPASRVRAAGYRFAAVGEVIAWGTGSLSSPRALVRGWMKSPPHRRIILSRTFREIGVGLARSGRKAYATADFGRR
jgi:uncharacterized protein YkwD